MFSLRTTLSSALLGYLGYQLYQAVFRDDVKIDKGASSEAPHDAVDNAEEASMDSFPASDPPAANSFN